MPSKSYLILLTCCFTVLTLAQSVVAQQPEHILTSFLLESEPPRLQPGASTVIDSFIKNEIKTRESLNQHTFKRDVLLQTIGPNGEVTGEYIRNSQLIFDDKGNRIERVLFHPASTIRAMKITKEDIQDLAGAQLLGIDIAETDKYELKFVAPDVIDGQEVWSIDVRPLQAPDPHRMRERYFVGRVWVDRATFQIVKTRGIVEPHGKQRFPLFETWRRTPNGDLLFPSYTGADDVLHFPNADVHYRIKVRYYDYKRFASKVSIYELEAAN